MMTIEVDKVLKDADIEIVGILDDLDRLDNLEKSDKSNGAGTVTAVTNMPTTECTCAIDGALVDSPITESDSLSPQWKLSLSDFANMRPGVDHKAICADDPKYSPLYVGTSPEDKNNVFAYQCSSCSGKSPTKLLVVKDQGIH